MAEHRAVATKRQFCLPEQVIGHRYSPVLSGPPCDVSTGIASTGRWCG